MDYLDLIQHPEKTPKLTIEGKAWAAGRFNGEKYIRSKSYVPSKVHIALTLNYIPEFKLEGFFGWEQLPTIENVDIHKYHKLVVSLYGVQSLDVLCPTQNVYAVITPLYPNFQQIMENSVNSQYALPHTTNVICRRCVSSYHALRNGHEDPKRADRLLRGIGMRQLKGLKT